MNLLTEIPGYAEAIARERLVREAAFLPVTESLGGFEVLPMTFRHFTLLRMMGSPVLHYEDCNPAQLAAFLWILNPFYSQEEASRLAFYRRCQVFTEPPAPFWKWQIPFWRRRCAKAQVEFVRVLEAAHKYVEETFMDAPAQDSKGGFAPSYYSDAAWVCAFFAREFGWDDDATMDKPLKRIWQYLKDAQAVYQGNKATLFNPSDKVRGEWLAAKNKAKCN